MSLLLAYSQEVTLIGMGHHKGHLRVTQGSPWVTAERNHAGLGWPPEPVTHAVFSHQIGG